MGSYQGKLWPAAPPPALGNRNLQRALSRLEPTESSRPVPVAGRGHPVIYAPRPIYRPSPRLPVRLHRRFHTAAGRGCSRILRTLGSCLRGLSSVCRRGLQRRPGLSAPNLKAFCRALCSAQGHRVTPLQPATPRAARDSSTSISLRDLGESRQGEAEGEGDPSVPQNSHDLRRSSTVSI